MSPSHARRRRNNGSVRNRSNAATSGIAGRMSLVIDPGADGGTAAATEIFTVIGDGAVTVAAMQVPFGIVVVHVKLTPGVKPAGAGVGIVVTSAPNDPELLVTVTEPGSP